MDNLEVVFQAHYCVDDGRYNNNGWLQELPEPITKVAGRTWCCSARRRSRSWAGEPDDRQRDTEASLVKVALGERGDRAGMGSARPGRRHDWAGARLRAAAQRARGRGAGYDAYRLRTSAALHFATGATLTPTGNRTG